MVFEEDAVDRAKRHVGHQTMRGKEPVERIPGPAQRKSVQHDRQERGIQDLEPRIRRYSFEEAVPPQPDSPDLSQELDLKEGDRRNSPGTIIKYPGEPGQALRVEDDPEQEVGIEQDQEAASPGNRTQRLTRPLPVPTPLIGLVDVFGANHVIIGRHAGMLPGEVGPLRSDERLRFLDPLHKAMIPRPKASLQVPSAPS
jgi:hypothetical protein